MTVVTFDRKDIDAMDRIRRLTLINSLGGIKSANLIGTTDQNGRDNLALFNSVVHVGSNPPLMGMVVRPTVVPRHTYNNIRSTGHFTINHVSETLIDAAHQTSANYDESTSEFEAAGLTPVRIDAFPAPFVGESVVRIALHYVEEHLIGANNTIFLVGEIAFVECPAEAIRKDGALDLGLCGTVGVAGLDTYWTLGTSYTKPYARP